MIIERFGDPEKARIPRPIRVKLENAKSRNEIGANAEVHKHKEGFGKVYVKKDVHPAIRVENVRIHKLIKHEKSRPENQGCNIVYDWKARVVKRGEVIIDWFNPNF